MHALYSRIWLTCTFSSLFNPFPTHTFCQWLYSHCELLLIKFSTVSIGFNRAGTICGIAHILRMLLTNSYDVLDISSNNDLPSVLFESFCRWFSLVKFRQLNIASLLRSSWNYIYRTLAWSVVLQFLSKWARPNDPPFIPMKTSRVTHVNASQLIIYRGRHLLVWRRHLLVRRKTFLYINKGKAMKRHLLGTD